MVGMVVVVKSENERANVAQVAATTRRGHVSILSSRRVPVRQDLRRVAQARRRYLAIKQRGESLPAN